MKRNNGERVSILDKTYVFIFIKRIRMPMSEELVTISVRVRRDQAEEIDALAEERGVDRSSKMRELLAIALSEARLRTALDQLREGRVSVWRAAKLAGVTYREMLNAMREHNVPFPLSEDELRREIDETLRRK